MTRTRTLENLGMALLLEVPHQGRPVARVMPADMVGEHDDDLSYSMVFTATADAMEWAADRPHTPAAWAVTREIERWEEK